MKKLVTSFLALCLFSLIFTQATFAAYADGEYSVNYNVLRGDNDSVSIANDYFAKPAKVIIKDGKVRVQITLNKSGWTKSLTLDGSSGTVINNNEAADQRTVEFPVSDISKPVVSTMHVSIPDMNYDHSYTVRFAFDGSSIPQASASAPSSNSEAPKKNETTNTTANQPAANNNQANNNSIQTKPARNEAAKPAESDAVKPASSNEEKVTSIDAEKAVENQNAAKAENPKTGDQTNWTLLYGLLVISALFLVYQIRKTHFSKE